MIGIMRRIIAKEMPHITILISYQDTDVHVGTIYRASGWTAVAQNKGTSWTNDTRQRNQEQSLADKVRWEYRLGPKVNISGNENIHLPIDGMQQIELL
jgi:hypothetical protein